MLIQQNSGSSRENSVSNLISTIFSDLSSCVQDSQRDRNSSDDYICINIQENSHSSFACSHRTVSEFLRSATSVNLNRRMPRIAYLLLQHCETYKFFESQSSSGLSASSRGEARQCVNYASTILQQIGGTKLLQYGQETTFSHLDWQKAWQFALHSSAVTLKRPLQQNTSKCTAAAAAAEDGRRSCFSEQRTASTDYPMEPAVAGLSIPESLVRKIVAKLHARNKPVTLTNAVRCFRRAKFSERLFDQFGSVAVTSQIGDTLSQLGYHEKISDRTSGLHDSISASSSTATRSSCKRICLESESDTDSDSCWTNDDRPSASPAVGGQADTEGDVRFSRAIVLKIVEKLKARNKPINRVTALRCFRHSQAYPRFVRRYGQTGVELLLQDALKEFI